MMRFFFLMLACAVAWAAPPQLDVPYGPLQRPPLMPNFLLNLSLTIDDAGAAYLGEYQSANDYQGYFNPRLCYRYPLRSVEGQPRQPDLDPLTGYFSPVAVADARHACGADAFSGNLLNWATTSTLDLLRYGLTGGDRVIDEPQLTVLQRAWLPDGAVHADFYAHPAYFPRKAISGAAAAGLTPFSADTLYIVSCRNRVMFSATRTGTSCDAPRFGRSGRRLVSDKYFGEFNVRVSVCKDGDTRPDLCHGYGAAAKPEGMIQKSARSIKIGIMSYLTEQGASDPAAYGGALRVPLRQAAGETDAASGVAATAGAIDVVNRIGRSNPARLGAYKAVDPGAEMYYEALRYLQDRPPSVADSRTRDDGLPLVNNRTDPVVAACQRNIIATIGHPTFGGDRYVPGNTLTRNGDGPRAADPFAPSSFDVMEAARKVGELEADRDGAFGNHSPRADLLHLDTLDDGAGSYDLAGAAYWAHTNPIRRDAGVHVDSFSLQLGGGARAASSALYLAAKYGAFDDRNADANPFITLGGARSSSEWSLDGATPAHFHQASEPGAIVDAVRSLFGGAAASGQGASGPSAAWRGMDGAFVVQTSGHPGSVRRHALVAANGDASVMPDALWDAGALLAARPAAERAIYTFSGSATIAFQWSDIPAALRGELGTGAGQALVDFLRGDRSRELGQPAGQFRRRDGVLGDIVHSVPLIVGAPSASGEGDGFAAFREQYRRREPAVYVGANDGMLHAFSASDGRELFAYMPRALMGAVAQLADPAFQGRAFADGSATQADATVAGRWRTVLAAGMGMGARGVIALDISDPTVFSRGLGALWEFTDRDDPAMGHVLAAPQIVKLNTAARGRAAVYRYFVLVASGINSLAPDGDGRLFLLSLDKPPAQPWRTGVNYYSIATSGADASQPNALSDPGLVTSGDGSAIFAYAGDLQGKLWRFDLAARNAQPLFQARDAEGRAQAITHAPKAVFAPAGGYLVAFGTGKLLEQSDILASSFLPQSIYAFHDRLHEPPDPVATRAQLAPRTLSGNERYSVRGAQIDYFGPNPRLGWYIDFANARSDGERIAGGIAAVDGALVVSTIMPPADVCAPPSSRLYVLDALSGLAPGENGRPQQGAVTATRVPVASLLAPLLFEVGLASASRDATGAAVTTRSFALIHIGGFGEANGSGSASNSSAANRFNVRFTAKRLGWREVSNWQELHEAANR